MTTIWKRRWAGAVLAIPLALAVAGLGAVGTAAARAARPALSPRASATGMPMPAYTKTMRVRITAPANGTTITANTFLLHVAWSGYTATCAAGFAPPMMMMSGMLPIGHYHLKIDNSLIDMYCTHTVTVSMQNLTPGRHLITVVPALTDHAEVMTGANSITIDWKPTHPPAVLGPVHFAGKPSIQILSPKPGAVLSGAYTMRVRIRNFAVSCALEGKPDLTGRGHWHVNVDTMHSAMNGMATMARMGCTQTVQLFTRGFAPGPQTLIAYLAADQHSPVMPMVSASVRVTFAKAG